MRSSAESLPSEPVPASASGLIGWVAGHAEGPLLLCIGGLHGNEPAGVQALKPLVEQVRARRHALSGDFVAVVGNSSALAAGAALHLLRSEPRMDAIARGKLQARTDRAPRPGRRTFRHPEAQVHADA